MENADLIFPILIGNWEKKQLVPDGAHHLFKALRMIHRYIKGRYMTSEMLKKCLIKK